MNSRLLEIASRIDREIKLEEDYSVLLDEFSVLRDAQAGKAVVDALSWHYFDEPTYLGEANRLYEFHIVAGGKVQMVSEDYRYEYFQGDYFVYSQFNLVPASLRAMTSAQTMLLKLPYSIYKSHIQGSIATVWKKVSLILREGIFNSSHISNRVLKRCLQLGVKRSFRKGQLVFSAGEQTKGLYLILKGEFESWAYRGLYLQKLFQRGIYSVLGEEQIAECVEGKPPCRRTKVIALSDRCECYFFTGGLLFYDEQVLECLKKNLLSTSRLKQATKQRGLEAIQSLSPIREQSKSEPQQLSFLKDEALKMSVIDPQIREEAKQIVFRKRAGSDSRLLKKTRPLNRNYFLKEQNQLHELMFPLLSKAQRKDPANKEKQERVLMTQKLAKKLGNEAVILRLYELNSADPKRDNLQHLFRLQFGTQRGKV